MKFVFAGSPEFAVTVLKGLLSSVKEAGLDCELVAVITQPDKPVGRKKVLTPTPVKAYAQELSVPVYDWTKVREHVDEVKSLGADFMITCAYGQILTQAVLDCFPYGTWNIHASLLPKFRGASPIQSAVLAGESHTGVTVMKTELALDAGDMLLVKRIPISGKNCEEVESALAQVGGEGAFDAVKLLLASAQKGYKGADFFADLGLLMQDESQATFCKKISKADAKICWQDPAEVTLQKINAFCLDPVAWCQLNGATFNISRATLGTLQGEAGQVLQADKKGVVVGCGTSSIVILQAQPAGGKFLSASDLVNGRKIKVGDRLE